MINEELDVACFSSDGRVLVFNSSQLQVKTSKSTQGVAVMTLKAKRVLERAVLLRETEIKNSSRYRVKNLPGAGAMLLENDKTERQISLLD